MGKSKIIHKNFPENSTNSSLKKFYLYIIFFFIFNFNFLFKLFIFSILFRNWLYLNVAKCWRRIYYKWMNRTLWFENRNTRDKVCTKCRREKKNLYFFLLVGFGYQQHKSKSTEFYEEKCQQILSRFFSVFHLIFYLNSMFTWKLV